MSDVQTGRTFTVASDENLEALVDRATRRLVVISPGLRMPVAEAIVRKLRAVGPDFECVVMVDADPEVCRLGYGDFAALELTRDVLTQGGREVRSQAGLRIGLVIADEEMLIFSPTPLLVEPGSTAVERPNAIQLFAPPESRILEACGVSAGATPRPPEIGRDAVTDSRMAAAQASLKETPPRRFDLARFERVFNYQMEFVELSLEEFQLKTRKVPLPAVVLGLTDPQLQERLRNSFRVFDGEVPLACKIEDPRGNGQALTLTEKYFKDELARIREKYSFAIKGYGRVIFKRNETEFAGEVERLKGLLASYSEFVQENLDAAITPTRKALVQELMPRLRERPPEEWVKRTVAGRLDNTALEERLERELDRTFAKVKEGFDPVLRVVFKAVTYETIVNDPGFHKQITAELGESEAKKLFREWDVVRARQGA